WGLCARNFALGAVVAASVLPPAGGVQLPTSVRPFCPLSPGPPRARDAPARAAPFSHTPRPVRPACTVAVTLPPPHERRPCRGTCVRCPPLSVPARPVPSPARRSPEPPRTPRARAPCRARPRPLPALGSAAPPGVVPRP